MAVCHGVPVGPMSVSLHADTAYLAEALCRFDPLHFAPV